MFVNEKWFMFSTKISAMLKASKDFLGSLNGLPRLTCIKFKPGNG